MRSLNEKYGVKKWEIVESLRENVIFLSASLYFSKRGAY